jgi:photosystem II stability/assembly factor-like uncharacterized protein
MKLAVHMAALTSLKRNWIWAGLLLLCMLIAATAFIAPSRIGRMELRNDAKEGDCSANQRRSRKATADADRRLRAAGIGRL